MQGPIFDRNPIQRISHVTSSASNRPQAPERAHQHIDFSRRQVKTIRPRSQGLGDVFGRVQSAGLGDSSTIIGWQVVLSSLSFKVLVDKGASGEGFDDGENSRHGHLGTGYQTNAGRFVVLSWHEKRDRWL